MIAEAAAASVCDADLIRCRRTGDRCICRDGNSVQKNHCPDHESHWNQQTANNGSARVCAKPEHQVLQSWFTDSILRPAGDGSVTPG